MTMVDRDKSKQEGQVSSFVNIGPWPEARDRTEHVGDLSATRLNLSCSAGSVVISV